jgi:hypothetical protein
MLIATIKESFMMYYTPTLPGGAETLTVHKKNVELTLQLIENPREAWRVYQLKDQQCVNWSVTIGRRFASRCDALKFIQEKGYIIAEEAERQTINGVATAVDHVYRFRAECQHDVDELRCLLEAKFKRITITNEPPFPDVEVELEIGLSLEELRNEMRRVVDGHVMVQTVARREEYTGNRVYEV